MINYHFYIKSHSEAPDHELEFKANNRKEAIDYLFNTLKEEFDRSFINKHLISI